MGGATWSRAATARSGAGRAELRDRGRHERPSLGEKLRHAVDLAVAFATLRDESDLDSAHEPVGADHPHRTPLRPPTRPRRPGAAVHPRQRCTTRVESTGPRRVTPRSRSIEQS